MDNKTKKLQKIWYKKLKSSGFNDLEHADGTMNSSSMVTHTWKTPLQIEVATAYYELANRFLNEYEFQSEIDRSIWEYHSNGISYRNIVKLLNKVNIRLKKDSIWRKISSLRSKMKARYLK